MIYNCRPDGNFHPELAIQHMSGPLGYITLSEDNPTLPMCRNGELYQLVGGEPPPEKAQTTRGIQPEDKDKIQELQTACPAAERESGSEKQKSELEEKKQFSHFTGLDMPLTKLSRANTSKQVLVFCPKPAMPV